MVLSYNVTYATLLRGHILLLLRYVYVRDIRKGVCCKVTDNAVAMLLAYGAAISSGTRHARLSRRFTPVCLLLR